jgi:alcohol dehydrogenase
MSLIFSREAWRHLAPNFVRVLEEPQNLSARAEMQLGACLAGLAIENSMLGGAHALANPLTATYGIVHGEAVALMLPHVIRHNGRHVDTWYRDLAQANGVLASFSAADSAAESLANFVAKVSRQAGLAGTLTECGVPREELPQLAAAATKQWTGKYNPVALTEPEFQRLYESAL